MRYINLRLTYLLTYFAVRWAGGGPQPGHESMMPLLLFSLLNI